MTKRTTRQAAKIEARPLNNLISDINGTLQIAKTDVLVACAKGLINAEEMVLAELAFRGLSTDGTWVGFPAAATMYEARTGKSLQALLTILKAF